MAGGTELAQNHLQLWVSVLAAPKIQNLLPGSRLVTLLVAGKNLNVEYVNIARMGTVTGYFNCV
jgi:hypothetical protein